MGNCTGVPPRTCWGRGWWGALPEPEPFEAAAKLATDLTITGLRIGTCALMVHHGIDKLGVRLYSVSTLPIVAAYHTDY